MICKGKITKNGNENNDKYHEHPDTKQVSPCEMEKRNETRSRYVVEQENKEKRKIKIGTMKPSSSIAL